MQKTRIELRPGKPSGCQVGKGRPLTYFQDLPAAQAVTKLAVDEYALSVTLRGVIWRSRRVKFVRCLPDDGIAKPQRFVMEEAVDQLPDRTHPRIEDNQPPARPQHAARLSQSGARILEMMPNVEQD